jgi:opacity protein-like surface antigen
MNFRPRLLALLALLAVIPAAHAQYYGTYGAPEGRPVQFYAMGGFSQPIGYTNSILQGGYDVGFGLALRQPDSPLALRLEINYANNNATHALIDQGSEDTNLQITGGWAETWSFTANGEYRVHMGPGVYGYVVGGIGAYYTQISLTQYGYGYVCDPWWGFCYFASGNVIVAQHDDTKFGFNAGLGIAFRLRGTPQMFVEARYTEIETPQKFQYIPITFGVRF